MSPDTLSGIPFIRPIDCDSCRVRIARTEVDSIRFGDPAAGFWSTAIMAILAPPLIMGILCLARYCPWGD